jgi:hypothetical protein
MLSAAAVVILAPGAWAAEPPDDAPLSLRSASSVPISLAAAQEPGLTTTTTTTTTEIHEDHGLLGDTSKFMTGMEGFERFVMPVGMPVYFEDPFITTDMRLIYIYHRIPDGSVLRGGQVHLAAVQLRVALTDRLAFIATKDGYSWFDSHITPAGDGWNDIAIGLKYAFYQDVEEQMIVSGGLRWEWQNGSSDAMQGGNSQEISPFVSMAKGWDKWHFLGALNGRIPTNRGDANASIVWNLHLDYELTETFRPLIEIHGIHWVSNADRLPLSTDYLDVGSLGASDAAGHDFFSAGLGFRWDIHEDVSLGATYEFPLESPDENLQEYRLTMNTVISF